ncbi:DegT/DnrJ/EryC1/StrS aminotransferase family protein, partial [uncultured Dubosiella sp.]|uniref:DegT/DnrJ/EryC1/StrS family aminotransferase n=1 Tax=uncultured Dubosiella sp. TaxID=1937011 RepID=UPI0025B2AD60
MKFKRLNRQSRAIKKEIGKKIFEVLESSTFIQGPNVKKLEQELANFVGVDECITCANGTDALILAIKALNIQKNDVVFVPDFTFFASGETPAYDFTFVASAEAIVLANAIPVFVDVDIKTMTMDPKDLEEKINEVQATMIYHPKAIVTVDLFGNVCDYESIKKIAKRYDLPIIEDAAQAFGSEYKGKKAGSIGTIGTTSFFPAKNVGCYGDGGAVFTNDLAIAKKIRSIANHGREDESF